MIKKLRKAFTIMELVIVIAIIAILAAVLILTFSNILRKSQVSSDTQLIRNLNIALEMDKASGNKHETMHSALLCAKEAGYDVSKINAQATDNEILWDSVNDVFCYLNDNEIEYIPDTKIDKKSINIYEYWRIYKEIPETQTYSIYWNNEDEIEKSKTFTVGFDAGYNEKEFDVNYVGANDAQKITIRTNGQNLSIGETNDHIKHYGLVRNLNVEKVNNTDCYCEYGYVGTFIEFGQGKYIANKAIYHQNEEEINGVLEGKIKTLTQVKYGEHYYGEDGKCIICGVAADHEHNVPKWESVDDDNHKGECSICHSEVVESHTIKNGTCNKCKYTALKNGLVDGYYYVNDVRYTGSVDGDDGKTYNFKNGMLIVNYSNTEKTSDENKELYGAYSFEYEYIIPTNENYVTKEIILDACTTNDEDEWSINDQFEIPAFAASFKTLSTIKIDSSNTYKMKISTSYTIDINEVVEYLRKSIKENKEKEVILKELKDNYGLDESYYPIMTYSDDFKKYLNKIIYKESISNKDEYENVKNNEYSFGNYLKETYSKDTIEGIKWDIKSYYYDGWNTFPNENSTAKKNGIFNGNPVQNINGVDRCTIDDPEILLLYFTHTYSNVIFTSLSSDNNKISELYKAINNLSSNLYQFGDEDWISKASNYYEVNIQNIYNSELLESDTSNNSFYLLMASHAFLFTNMHSLVSFPAPSFEIIILNTNYKGK